MDGYTLFPKSECNKRVTWGNRSGGNRETLWDSSGVISNIIAEARIGTRNFDLMIELVLIMCKPGHFFLNSLVLSPLKKQIQSLRN
jgi:hypothetical protein